MLNPSAPGLARSSENGPSVGGVTSALALLAPLGAFVGLFIGARLTRSADRERWLRDQRLTAYVDYLRIVDAVNSQFAVGMRVSRLQPEQARASGHDFEGVEVGLLETLDDLEDAEMRLDLLGGELRDTARRFGELVAEFLAAGAPESGVTEEEWDRLVDRGNDLRLRMRELARTDLRVPS